MRRTAVVLVLLGLVGCSTAPIAGFLDLVAPGRIRDGWCQPYGGVCVPHPVGGVVPPIMSVPIRSQSGAKSELRIHACRSPAKGVPGETIGLGAKRYKKSPPLTMTSGRKK